MIRHIVMWRVGGDTQDEKLLARASVKRAFEGLRGRIPGLRHLEVGLDHGAVGHSCDVVLIADCNSQAALDSYAGHPEHLRVREELGTLRRSRHQVDYVVNAD